MFHFGYCSVFVYCLLMDVATVEAQNIYENPCASSPCQFNGKCQRIGDQTHYLCECQEGHWGQHCEFLPGETPCLNNLCENQATCRPDHKATDRRYVCLCTGNYYGTFCNKTKLESESGKRKCENLCRGRGEANYSKGTKKGDICECKCYEHMYAHSGKNKYCEKPLGCANYSKCEPFGVCELKNKEPKCKCIMHYQGDYCKNPKWCHEMDTNCKMPKNPCDSTNCENGGNCLLVPNMTAKRSTIADWIVPMPKCNCTKNRKGNRCQLPFTSCTLTDEEDFCNENIGSESIDVYKLCGELNKTIELCYNNGTCTVANNSKSEPIKLCKCKSPWVGVDCLLKDECKANSSMCLANSTCISVPSEHGTGLHTICLCPPGQSDANCHARDPNVCNTTEIACHFGGICVSCYPNAAKISPYCRTHDDFTRHYVCACPIRRTGPLCDQTTFPCDVRRCRNGGSCIDMNETDYECRCIPGYDGRHCEEISDMCTARDPCVNGGLCDRTEEEPRFKCDCKQGFYGVACQREYYSFNGAFLNFYAYLAIWSFITGSMASVVFGVVYWLVLFCILKTKTHKQRTI